MFLLSVDVSYNLPKFSSCASWNPNGITFADYTTVGSHPFAVFVDNNNTVYVSDQANSRIQVWREGSVTPTRTLSDYSLIQSLGLFVKSNGNICFGYSSNNQVHKWSWNTASSVPVANFSASCFWLFIDKNNNLYCSLSSSLQVVMITLDIRGRGRRTRWRTSMCVHTIFIFYLNAKINKHMYICRG